MEEVLEVSEQKHKCRQLGLNAASAIAQHYHQEVHSDSCTSGPGSEPAPLPLPLPYFDSLHGGPVTWKPVTRHWADVISDHTTDKSSYIEITQGLIDSYVSHIRPRCFHIVQDNSKSKKKNYIIHNSAHLILSEFEMILSNHLYHGGDFGACDAHDYDTRKRLQLSHHPSIIGFEFEKNENNHEIPWQSMLKKNQSVLSSVDAIVWDIFALTDVHRVSMCRIDGMKVKTKTDDSSKRKQSHASNVQVPVDESKTMDILRNSILPTLLRILHQYVNFLGLLLQKHQHQQYRPRSSEAYEASEGTFTTSMDEKLKYTLMISLLASLAFCSDCTFGPQVPKVSSSKPPPSSSTSSSLLINHLTSTSLNILEILPHEYKKESTLEHVLTSNSYTSEAVRGYVTSANKSNENNANDTGPGTAISFTTKPIIALDDCKGTLPMPWMDHAKGIGFRSGRMLLRAICVCALSLEMSATCSGESGHNKAWNSSNNEQSAIGIIIRACGEEFSAKGARAHLFGRLMQSSPTSSLGHKPSTNYEHTVQKDKCNYAMIGAHARHSGDSIDINTNTNTLTGGDDQDISERSSFAIIASSIRLIAAYRYPHISDLVWIESLPMIYSLIDSINASCQSLGAAILILFFDGSTPTSFICASSSVSQQKQKQQNQTANGETLLHILGMACKTCNDAISLSMLYKARCRAFSFLSSTFTSNNPMQRLQRAAVHDCLMWIYKNSYCGPSGDAESLDRLRVVLICGAYPLLHQLVQLPNANANTDTNIANNANAIEVARLGMSALLPLIRWDSTNEATGRTVQCASIVCLLVIMVGAYPIMPRHGGKIMSELLSCIGRLERDICIEEKVRSGGPSSASSSANGGSASGTTQITETGTSTTTTTGSASKILLRVALHAASVTLILCGKQASEVLERVEKGGYAPSLILSCATIRAGAETMQHEQGTL